MGGQSIAQTAVRLSLDLENDMKVPSPSVREISSSDLNKHEKALILEGNQHDLNLFRNYDSL